jgi:hypothetical protein
MIRALTLASLFTASTAWATPVQVVHHARLLDAAGAPVNGPRTVTVGVYASADATQALWSESFPVTLADGYFTALLGSDTVDNPLHDHVFDGSPRYVGVSVVGSGALGPRQLLGAVPAAVHSVNLSGGAVDATSASISGTLRLGTGSATCEGGALEGTIRYTSAGGFEGCTATGWGPLGGDAWSCDTQPSHPGCVSSSDYASCAAIRDDRDFDGTSGEYWIDPDSGGAAAPFRVWCEMEAAGGGWTLAGIVSSGDGIAGNGCPASLHWEYADARWTDTSVLNDSVFDGDADRKYRSWSAVPLTALMVEETVGAASGYKAWSVGAFSSLSQLFGGGCTTLASAPLAVGGTISADNAVIYTDLLRRNCNCDLVNNDDVCRLWGNSPNNPEGSRYNGGYGLGVDGDTGSCSYDSEARPSRGGWTNQSYPTMTYYTGGLVWGSGGTNVGAFVGRVYVR